MAKEQKDFALISIVAIVAIVGMIVLILGAQGYHASTQNAAGLATSRWQQCLDESKNPDGSYDQGKFDACIQRTQPKATSPQLT